LTENYELSKCSDEAFTSAVRINFSLGIDYFVRVCRSALFRACSEGGSFDHAASMLPC